jgi:hypothetical protein
VALALSRLNHGWTMTADPSFPEALEGAVWS